MTGSVSNKEDAMSKIWLITGASRGLGREIARAARSSGSERSTCW